MMASQSEAWIKLRLFYEYLQFKTLIVMTPGFLHFLL